MKNFVDFLLAKVYKSIPIPEAMIQNALLKTIADVQYHFPMLSEAEISYRIETNNNELAVFLFRLGREAHLADRHDLKPQLHWLLKELCCCEIYFNNEIGEGFCVVHGTGTILGSRNVIGKGFKIHQGCTIGHRKNGEGNGNIIGDNVTMYANASIIGELTLGSNIIIGGHVMVTKNVESDKVLILRSEIVTRSL
ncbi:MAG TPA: hypothetical protein VK528_06095 [Flavobacterium sp.]|nr:hypothetical protein [Flavobacterium sp.]